MKALIDTSFLLATVFEKDKNHQLAKSALQSLRSQRLIAAPVLAEIFYMTLVRVGYDRAVDLFDRVTSAGFIIVDPVQEDFGRMQTIMKQYRDAELDFADVAQMAIAERLNIRHIFTFDRRDFSLFKPRHCDYLELLP